ncbi:MULTISPECIES: cation-translocating P-type ATPase [unclassified Ruminococcus]|uniref:heavy metal translocating P-type ATPase n=1 Tax=unclassified Ruminococcus TaxID=2608920 RepID=UPI00319E098F
MKNLIRKLEELLDFGGTRKDITFLIISGIAIVLSLLGISPFPFDMSWIAIVLCGLPIILDAIIGLVTEFDIKADVLVSLALIASVCIGEDFAAGEVAFIMQLGGLLEELTVARARAGIEKLVHLTPQIARVIKDGKENIIPAEKVQVGDILRVLPGEGVPVDGIIISGQTSVNQAVMTGESLPVDKTVGDEVSSGTVNQFGAFEMKASKVGEDSSIQRMIRLVQSADAGKAKIVGIADRWATWIVVTALTAAALTWLISGQIIRAVTILVVFCPCALVLATPTAIMAAIGNATKHGFLVREGDALERLARVKVIAFDKTGTLTYGTPKVVAAVSNSENYNNNDIYRLAASAEQLSEHPLGKAIVNCCKREGAVLSKAEDFQMIPGRGVCAVVDGKKVLAGNPELLKENGVDVDVHIKECVDAGSENAGSKEVLATLAKGEENSSANFSAAKISKELSPKNTEKFQDNFNPEQYIKLGCTVTYVAIDGNYAGFIALSDTLREESTAMIDSLNSLNVQSVLLTGDHENAAKTIASQLHINEVRANCLPEDKLKYIDSYQQENKMVCMIGDGINDAPALKRAEVGIAMGGVGSDIAVDAADIALVDDEIRELPHLIALSKRMMTTIRLNMTFSMTLNFIAIVLAITGILNPIVGALVHNAGSVLVITNSAFLLKWKKSR